MYLLDPLGRKMTQKKIPNNAISASIKQDEVTF